MLHVNVMATDTAIRGSIQNLLEGVQIIGYDWTYLYLNEAAERHARRPAADLIGRRMPECYPGIELTQTFAVLSRVMQSRQPEQFLSEFLYPDGTQAWFDLLVEPVPDGVCVVSLDISDTHRAQAQLRQGQTLEAVGRLAGERAERLTRQLLAFSRTEVLAPPVIDLNAVVLDLHALLTRVVGDDIRLVLDPEPALQHTRADPGQIAQVLMNLVVNARDAMAHGGTVRIATANATLDRAFVRGHTGSIEGEYVALLVEDSGHGIPADILAHVFEPFFTTKGPGKGTGLGLPTVSGIVKQSGGYVAIDTAPGIGSTITAYLPVCHEPLTEVPPPRQEPRTVSGTETVLLVEDDAATRELMCRTLAAQGYTVVAARDVWNALTLARSRASRIDLLLIDIVMPDRNGPQFAQHVVTMHPKIRVLYVSGFPQASALGGQALSARVSFLPKPFTPGTLLASVREALDA